MKPQDKIIKALEGKSEEEIEKELLKKFGFVKIAEFMTRADGSIIVDNGLGDTYDIEFELWVDYKNKRVLLYKFGYDLDLLDGKLTKEEEKEFYS